MGWREHIGDLGAAVGIDRYGASAPGEVLLERFGITAEAVAAAARQVIARARGATS
jgi:transketolase